MKMEEFLVIQLPCAAASRSLRAQLQPLLLQFETDSKAPRLDPAYSFSF